MSSARKPCGPGIQAVEYREHIMTSKFQPCIISPMNLQNFADVAQHYLNVGYST